MGIVEYAASTCLAASGVALAAPFLESKVPALEPLTKGIAQYRKFIGIFGIVGGALGLLLIPVLLLLFVGFGGLGANPFLLIPVALELIGCVATVALGVMVMRTPPPTGEPHSGEIDFSTIAGFGGIAYGGFLLVVITIAEILS